MLSHHEVVQASNKVVQASDKVVQVSSQLHFPGGNKIVASLWQVYDKVVLLQDNNKPCKKL